MLSTAVPEGFVQCSSSSQNPRCLPVSVLSVLLLDKGAFLLAVTNVKCQEEVLVFQLLLAIVPEVSQSGEGAVDTSARQ